MPNYSIGIFLFIKKWIDHCAIWGIKKKDYKKTEQSAKVSINILVSDEQEEQ
jgi:hypothetical protein